MYMINKHSIAGRMVVGYGLGFLVGMAVFFLLPALGIAHELAFRLGLWVFYLLLGVMVALLGVLTVHPLGFPLKWWMRGAIVGGMFHLMLVLVAFDEMTALMMHPMFAWMTLTSPFWVIVDGIILGMIIGGVATKVAGEGALPMR